MSEEEKLELIVKYYTQMENELLINIAKKIAMNKPMEIDKYDLQNHKPIVGSGGVNEWQLERLKELNRLNEENAKIIAKYSGRTIKEIEEIFKKAKKIGTEIDEEILEQGVKAGILNEVNPLTEEPIIREALNNAIDNTLTTFNRVNNSLLASAGNEYKEIVNYVSTSVLSGTKTVNVAMQESVTKLANKGLVAFTARNGAEWSPEAYTKMVIRTNFTNTINQVQEERMRLYGNDYVEISRHIGARPLCSEDQGQVFSLSGNTTPIEDLHGNKVKVRPWNESSYGQPAGILGINCRHSRYAFVPGLSINRPLEFSKSENDEAFKEQQLQRSYERNIRTKKREIEMLKQDKDIDKGVLKAKRDSLSEYTKKYTEFLQKTDRYRIFGNEWIYTK